MFTAVLYKRTEILFKEVIDASDLFLVDFLVETPMVSMGLSAGRMRFWSRGPIVCYTAVFSVVA